MPFVLSPKVASILLSDPMNETPVSLNRRDVIRGAIAGGITMAANLAGARTSKAAPPNIVLLLADDLRYDAVGYVNASVRTPNLNRLADVSVRFRNTFVTTSICSSSRASIFTSTYARRHGVWDFVTPLSAELLEQTYPRILRKNGYRTGFFGKYGVGDFIAASKTFSVPKADLEGFDEIDDVNDYYAPDDVERRHHNNERLAEKAENFIRRSPARQPFCLSVSFKAPHARDDGDPVMGPYVAEPDMLALYARDVFPRTQTMSEEAFATLPDYLQKSHARETWVERFSTSELWRDSVGKYYALVSGLDRAVGRVMRALETKGVVDNTLVIFASDNGYFLGDYGLEGKWFGYEASIRVPLLICPPGRARSRDVNATALNIDLAPTILAVAGVRVPRAMQGRDLSPLWRSASRVPWRTDFLYEHYSPGLYKFENRWEAFLPSSEGVRNDRYTYLRYPRQQGINETLFDRLEDPDQLKNIAPAASEEMLMSLRNRTDELIAQAGAGQGDCGCSTQDL
jgi:arylsulfatase A-like enzyme